MSEKNYKNQIEALLFASGRFMDANTLLLLTGASGKQVLINNVRKLKEEYDETSMCGKFYKYSIITNRSDGTTWRSWKRYNNFLKLKDLLVNHYNKLVANDLLISTVKMLPPKYNLSLLTKMDNEKLQDRKTQLTDFLNNLNNIVK